MTLNDIRKRSGLLIIVIGVAMLGFILTDLMNSGTSLFQKEQNILLKIDDENLTFTNFEKELENTLSIKFLSAFGTVNVTDEQRKSERDLLWDQKMKEILLNEKFHHSGIRVGKAETWDLISGEINAGQAPLFGYFFREQMESGDWMQYTPDLIEEWISMGSDNPQWSRYLFFKNNTTRERGFTKYYNAIKKGLYATEKDAKSYYFDQTKSISGQYIYIPFDNFNDDSMRPSEKDIKNYYKTHKSKFENSPERQITYFVFDLDPSETDKSNILAEMNGLISNKKVFNKRIGLEEVELGFLETDDVESFINQYGDNQYDQITFSKEEYTALEYKMILNNNVIAPYFDGDICKMARVVNQTKDSTTIVYLEREVYASDETLNEIYSQVFDFINNTKNVKSINEVLQKTNNRPRDIVLEKMDESVPGIGLSRQIVRWAFDQNTELNTSKFFDFQDQYIVAFLSDISEENIQPLSEVYDDIVTKLYKGLIAEKIINEINTLSTSTIEGLAKHFNTDLKSINQLKINSNNFGNEGPQPGAVGAFFNANLSEISEPFFANNGVFVFYKSNENNVNYPSDFTRYRSLIEKTHHTETDLLLVDILKDDKKIIDNRFNFY